MTNKLSIALVCDPIGSNKSGVVVSTMRFGRLLKERGHEVIFIGARSAEEKAHNIENGVPTYRYPGIPVPKSGGWHLAFPTARELKRLFKEKHIDVVHVTLPMSGALVAIKAARDLDIPVVAHSHSQPENLFTDMPKFMQPALGRLWNRYLMWVYGKASALVYPSELARSLLAKLSASDQPSAVISNGIDLKEFMPTEVGDFHERFDIPEKKVKVLFVGRLYPEKSIDTLLRAVPHIIEKHPDTHFMIAGAGHARPKLEKLIKDLDIGGHVTFLGLISDADKLLAYNASDIFVLPSLAELEGMVVLEAMATGKPIVISDAEMSASRYFVDGNGFLFKARDHEDLARQLLKLVTDPELRRAMGNASLENIKRYDIEESVTRLEELYRSTLRK